MNKIWLLLSVLVVALFVVSCAPKEVVEGEEIVEEVEEEGGALAGQAISGTCNDPDSVSTYDVAQVFNKSTTIKGTGKWVDQCQTVNSKIILKEGICKNGKMAAWQYSCSKQNKLPGDKFECVSGACVNKGVPTCIPNCEGKTCGDNGCGGSCGTCAEGQECQTDGICKAPVPASFCYYINKVTGEKYTKLWTTGVEYDFIETETGKIGKYCDVNNLMKPRCGIAGEGNVADKLVTNYNTYFIGGEGISLGISLLLEKCTSGCNINLKQCNPVQNQSNTTQSNITNTTSTCTPGPTGKIKCYTNMTGIYAKEELYYANCSTYFPLWVKQFCGITNTSCVEPIGCK